MPYGVADSLWRMLPADDQAAVRAGYEAAQASQPPPPPPAPAPAPSPTPAPQPATTNVGSSSAASSTDSAGRPIFYTDGAWYYADGSRASGPGGAPPAGVSPPPPPAPAAAPVATGAGALEFGDTGDDGTVFELFAAEAPDRNAPGGAAIRLPSTSWGDLRDYIAKDQPFLGTHIRNQGRQLKGVVASDLWSPST